MNDFSDGSSIIFMIYKLILYETKQIHFISTADDRISFHTEPFLRRSTYT